MSESDGSTAAIERNRHGRWERPCPEDDCSSTVVLLESLGVWLCGGGEGHAYGRDRWEVPTDA